MKKVSVVLPTHNRADLLPQALASVCEQTYRNLEIIVVDDASTDGTAEVARQHNATVLPVNHRQIAATRNSGARAAHGDRLFFVDADTTANPRAIASALRCLDKGAAGGGAWTRLEGSVPLYGRLHRRFFLPANSHEAMNLDDSSRGPLFPFAVAAAIKHTRLELELLLALIDKTAGADAVALFLGKPPTEPDAKRNA